MSTQIDSTYDALAWGSHLPALASCLGKTNGAVLEIGIGHFSTPFLHEFCVASQRFLVSLEDNKDWFDTFRSQYEQSGKHEFLNGDYDDLISQIRNIGWSVVFIDESPGGDRRRKSFEALKYHSEWIIVHDYHLENEVAIDPLLHDMTWTVFKSYQPPTLVATRNKQMS